MGDGMRPVLIGLAVVAAVIFVLGVAVISPRPAAADMVCVSSPSHCATEIADRHAEADRHDEQMEEYLRSEAYDAADAAEEWADIYLTEEKTTATYWRSPLVQRNSVTGHRMGRLGTSDGRYIYGSYVCDPNYDVALSGGCVPADRDYDCWELRSWGIVNIPIMDTTIRPNTTGAAMPSFIGDDWMLLDDDHDGMGCEVEHQPEQP
jgi:hypothetical protein